MSIDENIRRLASGNASERLDAARELAQSEDPSAAAIALVKACADSSAEVREWATSALEDMGPPDSQSADELAVLLCGPQADVAYWSATLLGRLGEEAAGAAAQLETASKNHKCESVRDRATWALTRLRNED